MLKRIATIQPDRLIHVEMSRELLYDVRPTGLIHIVSHAKQTHHDDYLTEYLSD